MLVIALKFPGDGGAGPESILDVLLGLVGHILVIVGQFLKTVEHIALVLHIIFADLQACVLVASVVGLIELFNDTADRVSSFSL